MRCWFEVLLAPCFSVQAGRPAVKVSTRDVVLGALAVIVLGAALWVWQRFHNDLAAARARAAHGSVLAATRCGPIEYQEAGSGVPLLVVHGSGGGHDQGMAFERALAKQGIRVIAMSRFGYLRTPMPADASAKAQADAHVSCSMRSASARRRSWAARPARRRRCRWPSDIPIGSVR